MAPKAAAPQQLLLTRRQTADILAVSERHVIDLEYQGVLKPVRIGRCVRHRHDDVKALADSGSKQ